MLSWGESSHACSHGSHVPHMPSHEEDQLKSPFKDIDVHLNFSLICSFMALMIGAPFVWYQSQR